MPSIAFDGRSNPANIQKIIGRSEQTVLLLVTGVMFLIHDEQARFPERGEDGRARANDDPCGAVARGIPGPEALAVRQARVQHRHGYREAPAEALEQLWSQADFRHEHQALPARVQYLPDTAQIDLGFAAARDAIQQEAAVG